MPWLTDREAAALHRPDRVADGPWTVPDLPLLDAARARVGDPDRARRRRLRADRRAESGSALGGMLEDLIAGDTSESREMSMLHGADLRAAFVDAVAEGDGLQDDPDDALDGPFLHVIVDEAQELTDAQWQVVLRRCPSRSLTIVGDRAQASAGFEGSWAERLARVGISDPREARLGTNYRTPSEIMAEAEPVIRAAVPDANVPASIRSSGLPVRHGRITELDGVLRQWLGSRDDGTACVIRADGNGAGDLAADLRSDVRSGRVRVLPPALVKGMEFDLVVLVDPDAFGPGRVGAAARYVAMTRATRELVVLTA